MTDRMPSGTPHHPTLQAGEETEIRVMLARFEAKLDVALAQHGAKLEQHGQEISEIRTRLQKVEDLPRATPEAILDHEQRLRAQEGRKYVTPTGLAAALATTVATLGGVVTFLDRLYAVS